VNKQIVRTSKFLSLVLRHKPKRIGLTLDQGGWARVDELIAAANHAGVPLDESSLRQVVEQNNKQRFAFSEDGLRIRASQGHSIPVDLGLEPREPPEFLYHGTATRFLPSISRPMASGSRDTCRSNISSFPRRIMADQSVEPVPTLQIERLPAVRPSSRSPQNTPRFQLPD
jgi:RNA:NAD 2'-phosphotransferase (TPT1/KptA family)